jgi:hypothetical protein
MTGSAVDLIDSVVGEMSPLGIIKPTDIPLSRAVSEAQYAELIKGDDDLCQVVIEVGPGQSSRGWQYPEAAIQKIVQHVADKSLAGIMGHQTDEEVSREFRAPVTHWIGATWLNGKAYFRGLVDKTAPDLKRWLRSGRVTQPSVFTRPKVANNVVVDLEPLGIDWAPLGRAGMHTARVIYAGETRFTHGTNTERQDETEMDANLAAGEMTAIASLLGTTPEQARARISGLIERARGTLSHDIDAASARAGVPESLRPLVGELAVGKLDAASASAADIARTVGEVTNGAAYKAARGNNVGISGTPHDTGSRTGSGAGVDMSVFGFESYRPVAP